MYIYVYIGGVQGVIITVLGNGLGNQSSNHG